MQTIAINNVQSEKSTRVQTHSIQDWWEKMIAAAEENRIAVSAVLILLQVTIAGFNVVIPPMIGASAFLMAPGVIMTFLANGVALAQAPMKWVVAFVTLSVIINSVISIYCFTQL